MQIEEIAKIWKFCTIIVLVDPVFEIVWKDGKDTQGLLYAEGGSMQKSIHTFLGAD